MDRYSFALAGLLLWLRTRTPVRKCRTPILRSSFPCFKILYGTPTKVMDGPSGSTETPIFSPLFHPPSSLVAKHVPVSLEDIKDAFHKMNGENRIERQGSNSQGDIFQIQSPLCEPELRIRVFRANPIFRETRFRTWYL